MCHSDPAAKSESGKSIAVDAKVFAGSVHGQMQFKCTDCHSDVSAEKLPHEPKLKPANCAGCHEAAVKEYRVDRAREGAQGRQRGGGDLHRLPRQARHPEVHRSRVAHPRREAGSDLRLVPRQRRRRPEGPSARRQHRGAVPRQHPRQEDQRRRRRRRQGADLHRLPWRPQDPRQDGRRQPGQPREHRGHVRQLPPAGVQPLQRQHARADAPGRQLGRADLHRLPQRARDPVAHLGAVAGRRHQGVRQLPRRPADDVPRHVPRPGDAAGLSRASRPATAATARTKCCRRRTRSR